MCAFILPVTSISIPHDKHCNGFQTNNFLGSNIHEKVMKCNENLYLRIIGNENWQEECAKTLKLFYIVLP